MSDGLSITKKEFLDLPTKQQNAILFENTEQIKRMVKSYVVQQRINFGWLTGLTAIGSWLVTIVWKQLIS